MMKSKKVRSLWMALFLFILIVIYLFIFLFATNIYES